jgi:hypothetical protein
MKLGCSFWLQWTILTVVGFGLSLYWVEVGEQPYLNARAGMIGGLTIAICQSLALRSLVPQLWQWIFLNTLAWTILGISNIGAIGWIAPRTDVTVVRLIYGVIYGSITGLLLSSTQLLALRSSINRTAFAWFSWLFGNSMIWAMALAIGWVIGGWLKTITNLFLAEVLGLSITWAIVAGLSGILLLMFLNSESLVRMHEN